MTMVSLYQKKKKKKKPVERPKTRAGPWGLNGQRPNIVLLDLFSAFVNFGDCVVANF
jgi:hypothetical protein